MKSVLMKVNEHLAPAIRGKATAYILLYKSAFINVVMFTAYRKKIFCCHFVQSALEDHHHATGAFQEAEKWAKELGCREVQYTTPLNKKVAIILFRLGWQYLPKLAYARYAKSYVNGFKKVIS